MAIYYLKVIFGAAKNDHTSTPNSNEILASSTLGSHHKAHGHHQKPESSAADTQATPAANKPRWRCCSVTCAHCQSPINDPATTIDFDSQGSSADFCRCRYCSRDYRTGQTLEQWAGIDQKRSTGQKYDTGKPRWSLVPWQAQSQVVDVLTYGAKKYGDHNWQQVPQAKDRYTSAAIRHITAWLKGEKTDSETGLHHLAHAICCLLFLLDLELKKADTDEQ